MLKSGKIRLRSLNDEDKEALAKLANNKKVWDNVRDYFPHPYSLDDAVAFIKLTRQENPQLSFAIELESQFCGMIGLVPQSDVNRITAEIGYWIGEPFWNKGIVSEAVRLITNYGLNELGFMRIHAGIFEHNIASMKVLEKNGYKKDGVFEKCVIKNGKILAEYRYSITR